MATVRSADVVAYSNASANCTTLSISKLKAGQTFTIDKSFQIFFFLLFLIIRLSFREVKRMIFYAPLTSLGEKPRNVCFQIQLHD